MNQSKVGLLDLPDEILLMILKKLDNIDVLYSLLDVDNQRLDIIAQGNIFINTLNFVFTTFTNDISSINDTMVDRFCRNILPRIHYNIKSLTVDSLSMERILFCVDYPNLTELKLFNFNGKIASHYFRDKGPFDGHLVRQITDLALVFQNTIYDTSTHYSLDTYRFIMQIFGNLKHLSIIGSYRWMFLDLSYHKSLPPSPVTFSSSTLTKLRIRVISYAACLAVLDGRFKQLRTLIVDIIDIDLHQSYVCNMDDLPNLKCFSLTTTSTCFMDMFIESIPFLFRRMINLEELTLQLSVIMGTVFIDGTHIYNNILIHLQQLRIFNFCICTDLRIDHLVHHLSKYDIQRTFSNAIYQDVDCMVQYGCNRATCHVFSLPFIFDYIGYIGNTFPSITFIHVRRLFVCDLVPFEHEFFIRIASCFPLLEHLSMYNIGPQLKVSTKLKSDNSRMNSIVKYSHLIWLELECVHIDYVEQFLNETKTHLPSLTRLTIYYSVLCNVTEDFTRYITRRNCIKVNQLNLGGGIIERSKDFNVYFPLL
ncbi:unnamed protein product [Rotaria socialis]|uniref:F-box domain-containing protein n=1 Tax=Rotaria socialis TaxID=392032 RepID=A0A820HT85_9BILA|nr:unnamed protein product [Rotaria socialis]CAF4301324.1 unnamed protein product [Rotaria socialis]